MKRVRAWQVIAALFTAVNLVGLGWAIAMVEQPHAGIHGVLAIVGAYFMWRTAGRGGAEAPAEGALGDDRLGELQQSVDAIAVEVERIGEAQRFNAKLQAERVETPR